MRHAPANQLERGGLILATLALTTVTYFPLTGNYFFADDFVYFFFIRNKPTLEYFLAPQAEHVQLTTKTFIYLQYLLFGPNPASYFWLALATHLLNAYLLFLAIEAFTRSPRLAAVGASLWGVSPAGEGSLGWYSVYGHVLVATAVLLLAIQLGRLANGKPPTRRTAIAWALLLFAAATSFGIGIGIVMAFPIAAAVMLPWSRVYARLIMLSALMTAVLPFVYVTLFRLYPSPFAGGQTLGAVLAPVGEHLPETITLLFHLLVAGVSSLVAGAAFDWGSYPGPFGYAIGAIVFIGVVLGLTSSDAAIRRRIAACLVLILGGYGMVAMGRSRDLVQGSTVPLRAIRYHYAVPALLAILVCLLLAAAGRVRWLRLPDRARGGLATATLALIAAVHFVYAKPFDHHDRARRETTAALDTMRQAIAAAPPNGPVYIPNQAFNSVGPVFKRVPWIFPGWAGVFVVFFPDNVVDGKRVFFVDDRKGVRRKALEGRRTMDLFVGTDDVAAAAPPQPAPPLAGAGPQ